MNMDKGYVIFVQAGEQKDYLSQAIALSQSIKIFNKINNVTLMTNCVLTSEQRKCFDSVIGIPGTDEAKTQDWKIQNRHKIYEASPYSETIVLDSDMLCLDSIDYWWNVLKNTDLYFTNEVKNYLGEKAKTNILYRKTFIKNNLPNIYCGMFYFKKTKYNNDFFAVLSEVMQNYKDYARKYCRDHIQQWCSLDVSTAITCKIMNHTNKITNSNLTFTHMKTRLQNWNVEENWLQDIPIAYDNKLNVKINNVVQKQLLHYVQDNFLTSELKEIIQNLWKEKTYNLA